MLNVISSRDKDRLNARAVKIIMKSLRKISAKKKQIIFGLCGGNSVIGVFHLLRKEHAILWKKVHIFMVDERLVPMKSRYSNFRSVKNNFIGEFISKKIILKENIHPFPFDKAGREFGLSDYRAELKKYGGKYDIVLLSAGEDGHIGSLFPMRSIKDKSESYIYMDDAPKHPKKRISASRKLLLKSKVAVLLFIGESKRSAYEHFFDEECSINECPARVVLSIKESYLITNLA